MYGGHELPENMSAYERRVMAQRHLEVKQEEDDMNYGPQESKDEGLDPIGEPEPDLVYVALHMFGSQSGGSETADVARTLKSQIFGALTYYLDESKRDNVRMLDGDDNFGVDVDLLTVGDPGAVRDMKEKNARICMSLFIVMRDAQRGEFSFSEDLLEETKKRWKKTVPGATASPLRTAETGTQAVVFHGGDQAYINFARCQLSKHTVPACALVVVEGPTDELTHTEYEKVYDALGVDETPAQELALGGKISVGGRIYPLRRLVPAVDARTEKLEIPFAGDAEPVLEAINSITLKQLAKDIDAALRAKDKHALNCPGCGGNQFGCPYCGGKNKKSVAELRMEMQKPAVEPRAEMQGKYKTKPRAETLHKAKAKPDDDAVLRKLLFKSR
jgi:hypothetical protein